MIEEKWDDAKWLILPNHGVCFRADPDSEMMVLDGDFSIEELEHVIKVFKKKFGE